jgi:sortase (surface protein transpeptidase)
MLKKFTFISRTTIFLAVTLFLIDSVNALLAHYPLYMPYVPELNQKVHSVAQEVTKSVDELIAHDSKTDYTNSVSVAASVTYGYPVQIVIERIDLTLPIELGYYDPQMQTWTLSDGKAYFATLSDLPSTFNGNTILYAHNREDAFLDTAHLVPGDLITIVLDTGTRLTYEFYAEEVVYPTNDAVFTYKDFPRLTLLTCEGEFSETRRLQYAKLLHTSASD